MIGYDPNHKRCIFPIYGRVVDTAMRAKGLSSADVASHLGIDVSAPRGWRRGISRNAPHRTHQLEALLGVKLPMHEVPPGAPKSTVAPSAAAKPILDHLAKIAGELGYDASFSPRA